MHHYRNTQQIFQVNIGMCEVRFEPIWWRRTLRQLEVAVRVSVVPMSRYFLLKVQYISRDGSRVANLSGGGTNIRFCQNFQKKIHEIEKMLGRGGGGGGTWGAP